ncbi:hypothetical protein RYX36_000627 [Vicia faba]
MNKRWMPKFSRLVQVHKPRSKTNSQTQRHNPDLLIVISGLNFDNDLSFLKKRTLDLNFTNKLVYEAHIYSFSGNQNSWNLLPVNWVCSSVIEILKDQAGFLISGDNPVPLFIREFGYDMTSVNSMDN